MKKSIFIFSLLTSVSGGISACSGSEWSSEDKGELIDRCRAEGGSRAYCNCYLENAMEKFPIASEMDQMDFETAVELSLECVEE
jgi:hypothetical protein